MPIVGLSLTATDIGSICQCGFPACLVMGLPWKKPTEMNASIMNNCCIQVQTSMVETKQDGIEGGSTRIRRYIALQWVFLRKKA